MSETYPLWHDPLENTFDEKEIRNTGLPFTDPQNSVIRSSGPYQPDPDERATWETRNERLEQVRANRKSGNWKRPQKKKALPPHGMP